MNGLEKTPVPLPLIVLESASVGEADVLKQIPLEITGLPPSLEIVPPPVAVDEVIDETAAVESVGITASADVVNEISAP